MSKILWLGAIVLVVGIAAAILAFKVLPAGGSDTATGAAIDTPGEETEPETPPTPTPAGLLSEIQEGMTESEVLDLAGEPSDKQTVTTAKGGMVQYWYYESGEDIYQIAFSDGQVSAIRKY